MDVLLVVWDGGGNVPPFVSAGRELFGRGHVVRCLGPDRLRTVFGGAGVDFRATRHSPAFDPMEPLSLEVSQRRQGEVFFGDGYRHDVAAEVARKRPDVVVVDCFLAAAQSELEAQGMPHAVLLHTLASWFVPFWDRALLAPTNAVRERIGLPVVGSIVEAWANATRVLVTSTPLLEADDPGPRRLRSLRHVGPVGVAEDGPHGWSAAGRAGSEPLVLVAFSTTAMGQEEALGSVVTALARLPVRALLTVGRAIDPAALPSAPNVRVVTWAPHADVLPHAALVITHAGHGTVCAALSGGVPLLCMPLGRDQAFIAERVRDLGAGMRVPSDSEPDVIAAAVTALLNEPAFRESAGRAAEAIREIGDGAVNLVDELEAAVAAQP